MFIKRIYLFLFVALFFNSPVFAAGIDASYGFGFGIGMYDLDADEGSLDTTTYASPIHLFYMPEMGSTSRLTIEFFHYGVPSAIEFESTPGKTLGTDVINSGFNFVYEEELQMSNSFKPILGIGLSVSKLVQESRFSTLDDGTLNGQAYEDKDDFVASALFEIAYDINFTDNFFIYTRLMQSLGISNDLTETQFLIGFMFHN